MDICTELRSHWPSQDDPELDDEDKCCLLLGMRAAAEIERLRAALVHIECEPINAEYMARAALDYVVPNAELTDNTK